MLRNTCVAGGLLSAVSALPAPSSAADALAQQKIGSLVEQVPTLVAEDIFGKTFLAGMSIALASVVATVFVGIVVRGNYDDIEASFFEAQEGALVEEAEKQKDTTQSARDFFGDVNVREVAPGSPPAQAQGEPD